MPQPLAADRHRAAVQLDQAFDQRQADAQPALRTIERGIDLGEHLEDIGELAGGDADAGILDPDHHLLALRLDLERDRAFRRRVLAGIREQIFEDLRNPHAVDLDHRLGVRQLDRQRLVSLINLRTHRVDRSLNHRAEPDRLKAQFDLALRDARDIEQVIDQPGHMGNLPIEHLHRPPWCRVGRKGS